MISIVKLYKDCKILPQKNFIVDNIADYLGTLSNTITIDNFQYIKHGLSIQIKIDTEQTFLEPTSYNHYNYVSIKNGTEKTYYYFVVRMEWRSTSTILLQLLMDDINTFSFGSDYSLDDKTKVIREHKDRLKKETKAITIYNSFFCHTGTGTYSALVADVVGKDVSFVDVTTTASDITIDSYSFDSSTSIIEITCTKSSAGFGGRSFAVNFNANVYSRKIDLYSEGLQPILYKEEKGNILAYDETGSFMDDQDWYLMIKGSTSFNTYLIPENGDKYAFSSNEVVNISDMTAGNYYYCYVKNDRSYKFNEQFYVLVNDGGGRANIVSESKPATSGFKSWDFITRVFVYWLDGGSIKYKRLDFESDDIEEDEYLFAQSAEYTDTGSTLQFGGQNTITRKILTSLTTDFATIEAGTDSPISISDTNQYIRGINEIDRTSTEISKIIKLPYCPVKPQFIKSYFDYDNTEELPLLKTYSDTLGRSIDCDYNPYEVLGFFKPSTLSTNRDDSNESKLFHSDFYLPKIVYDSFSFEFNFEKMDQSNFLNLFDSQFSLNYYVSNTGNTRFLFEITSYVCTYAQEDYHNIFVVARNNEILLYNSDYMTYIKNGYNYDVKSKNRQATASILGLVTSTVGQVGGAIASFASTPVTGIGGVVGGVSLLGSAGTNIASTVMNITQQEESLAQKKRNLSIQSLNIATADDVEIMSKYTGNRAKFVVYKVSPKLEKALADLFYYTGYVSDENKTPVVNTRTYFNFLACEPIFNMTVNINDDILDDIRLKFNAGVTFLHKVNNAWDFEQVKENWEVSLNV